MGEEVIDVRREEKTKDGRREIRSGEVRRAEERERWEIKR